MVKISLPYKPHIPVTTPGIRINVAPVPHIRFIKDVGYYDAMGRDPLQMYQAWGISDPVERVSKLEEILPEWPGPRHRRHILEDAAQRGDAAVVRFLVDTGLKVYPDIPGRNGVPSKEPDSDDEMENNDGDGEKDDINRLPLHVAAGFGHLECVKIILEGGKVHVDICDTIGRTPLCAAARNGHAEVIKYLLEQGADPTIRLDGTSKLSQEHFAALAGADALEFAAPYLTPETIKLLLEHPLYGSKSPRKYNQSSKSGVYVTPTAVYRAAVGKNIDTLKYLLGQGSYPLTGAEGKTKGELLDETQKEDIERFVPAIVESAGYDATQMMLSYLYPTDEEGEVMPFAVPDNLQKPFVLGAYKAIKNNDCKKFEWIYKFGVKEHDRMSLDKLPDDQKLNIQHLLDNASGTGSLDCIKMLIKKYGAQPDSHRLPPGLRPIYMATMEDWPEIVRYYLENYEIDLHFGNGSFITGPTALYSAITMKSLESVELLLKRGGPVDHIDDEILDIKNPVKAVLIAECESRTPIRLQTETNANDYIEEWKMVWQNFNPQYVRLELDTEDKEWISKLIPRKSNDALKKSDVTGRRLDSNDKTREDPVPYLVSYPCSHERPGKLAGDDDIMPAWVPIAFPATF